MGDGDERRKGTRTQGRKGSVVPALYAGKEWEEKGLPASTLEVGS